MMETNTRIKTNINGVTYYGTVESVECNYKHKKGIPTSENEKNGAYTYHIVLFAYIPEFVQMYIETDNLHNFYEVVEESEVREYTLAHLKPVDDSDLPEYEGFGSDEEV